MTSYWKILRIPNTSLDKTFNKAYLFLIYGHLSVTILQMNLQSNKKLKKISNILNPIEIHEHKYFNK